MKHGFDLLSPRFVMSSKLDNKSKDGKTMFKVAWGLGIQQMYQACNIPPSFHAYFFPTHNTQCIHALKERGITLKLPLTLVLVSIDVLSFIKIYCWERIRRSSNPC